MARKQTHKSRAQHLTNREMPDRGKSTEWPYETGDSRRQWERMYHSEIPLNEFCARSHPITAIGCDKTGDLGGRLFLPNQSGFRGQRDWLLVVMQSIRIE